MGNRPKRRDYASRRHPQHRGQATAANRVPGPGESYLLIPGLDTDRHRPGVEAELRQATHNLLYELAGEGTLTTGVWWTIHYGAEAADRYTRALDACGKPPPDPEELAAAGVQFEDNPSLLCVIAWAIGRPPP